MGLFDGLFGGSSNVTQPLANANNQANKAIKQGKKQALEAVQAGQTAATPSLQQAVTQFAPYNATGQSANTMEANALGLNGDAGNAAAVNAFHEAPGYQYTLNQGLNSVLRNQAQLGNTGSGNTMEALDQYGTNLANQGYNDWLGRLQGLGGQGLLGASGQAGALTNLGNLFNTDTGLVPAGIDTGAATALANNANSYGNSLASVNQAQNQSNSSLLGGLLGAGAKILGTNTSGTVLGGLLGLV